MRGTMIVYGILRRAEVGSILFSGSLKECREFVRENEKLDLDDYYSVNICEDNGIIVERVLESRPAYQCMV